MNLQNVTTLLTNLFGVRPQPRVTVDTIVNTFNETVRQLKAVQSQAEADADAAAALIAATEAKRAEALAEAGRAAQVAAKIEALVA